MKVWLARGPDRGSPYRVFVRKPTKEQQYRYNRNMAWVPAGRRQYYWSSPRGELFKFCRVWWDRFTTLKLKPGACKQVTIKAVCTVVK
jgi:hypothetical protein